VSRDKIKQAALELFQRYSYVKTSVSDIAAAAGIGKGTIYLSFKTKEEILFSILDDEISTRKHLNDPVFFDPTVSLEAKVELLSRNLLDLHFVIRDLMFRTFENVEGRELQDVYLKFSSYFDKVCDFFLEVLALHGHPAGRDRFPAVREFILFLSGRFVIYILSHDWNAREEIYRQMPTWAHTIFEAVALG